MKGKISACDVIYFSCTEKMEIAIYGSINITGVAVVLPSFSCSGLDFKIMLFFKTFVVVRLSLIKMHERKVNARIKHTTNRPIHICDSQESVHPMPKTW